MRIRYVYMVWYVNVVTSLSSQSSHNGVSSLATVGAKRARTTSITACYWEFAESAPVLLYCFLSLEL